MKNNRGFTFMEILVVVAIIMILLTLVIPFTGKAKLKARIARTKTEIAALEAAIASYLADMGTAPTDNPADAVEDDNTVIIEQLSGRTNGTGSWIQALYTNSDWMGPYMEFDTDQIQGGQFIDTWGRPYTIQIDLDGDPTSNPPTHNALSADIWSEGPTTSSGDEVTNW